MASDAEGDVPDDYEMDIDDTQEDWFRVDKTFQNISFLQYSNIWENQILG